MVLRRTSARQRHKDLEKKLGYRFKNRKLLDSALMHRSFRFEDESTETDNQRLEFLGDAVLGLVSAAHIYSAFKEGEEGTLTRIRSQITSGKALARIGSAMALGDELMMGKGETQSGGRRRASNVADALEAVIGAAYIDGGIKAAEKIFRKLFKPELEECSLDVWAENPKGRLQELSQRVWSTSPQYQSGAHKGPPHKRVFKAEVLINGDVAGCGEGCSKRDAESNAAVDALKRMNDGQEAL